MDYEPPSVISLFLALLPENFQRTPPGSLSEWSGGGGGVGGGYTDRMHKQRKSPCLSFDMYISNHFLNRISPRTLTHTHTSAPLLKCHSLYPPPHSSFLLRISLCFYISLLHASNVALISSRLAFSSLCTSALVF